MDRAPAKINCALRYLNYDIIKLNAICYFCFVYMAFKSPMRRLCTVSVKTRFLFLFLCERSISMGFTTSKTSALFEVLMSWNDDWNTLCTFIPVQKLTNVCCHMCAFATMMTIISKLEYANVNTQICYGWAFIFNYKLRFNELWEQWIFISLVMFSVRGI